MIQQSIDQLAAILSADKLRDLLDRLNSASPRQIGAEWEAIVLAAVARAAHIVRHEHDTGGSSRPDILVESNGQQEGFQADVTAISDSDLVDENPVDAFQQTCTEPRSRSG